MGIFRNMLFGKIKEMDIFISNHGKKRLKERLRVKGGGLAKILYEVMENGTFVRILDNKRLQIMYNDGIFVFDIEEGYLVFITVLATGLKEDSIYVAGKKRQLCYQQKPNRW